MKTFLKHKFDVDQCLKDLADFRTLLSSKTDLSEQLDILPFFRSHPNLSVFLGSFFPNLRTFDRLAFEYQLFGDFACDLVVGDSLTGWYCFIEFENADASSVFLTKKGKATPEWSPRFEHGFSQLVDWFWKMDDFKQTSEMQYRFERNLVRYQGLLVLGRSSSLGIREQIRKDWRLEKVVIDSKQVFCLTFDELYEDLNARLVSMTAPR